MIETVETNKSNDQDGTFDRNYTEVKRIKELIAEDGAKVPFTGNMKIVYGYLYTFQDNEKRHNYPAPIHPNMEMIAWENGITKPTAQKAVDALMQVGVLIKDQIQVGSGFKSNNYVVLKPSKVVAMGITPTHPNEAKSKNQNQKTEGSKNDGKSDPKEQQPAAVEPSTLGDDEQHGIQHTGGAGCDDLASNDEVSVEEDRPFPVPKAKSTQEGGHLAKRRRSGSFSPTIVEDYSGEYGRGSIYEPSYVPLEPSQGEIDRALAEM